MIRLKSAIVLLVAREIVGTGQDKRESQNKNGSAIPFSYQTKRLFPQKIARTTHLELN
jgi:hypothetical protein